MTTSQPQRDRTATQNPVPLALLTSGAVTALTLAIAFSLLAVGFEYFWVTFIVGFGVVLPAAPGVATSQADRETEQISSPPLDELKQRYARGEVTDEEFERRVKRLLNAEK